MKLVVALGNPGKEYENTRHNAGFIALDKYLKKYNLSSAKTKFNGEYYQMELNGEKVIFLKPISYINLSGTVIKKFIDYFKVDIANILVIHDDLNLEIGNFKIKTTGSSGGHNGLENIENQLQTQNYKRIKIGISKDENADLSEYVLSKFSKEDKTIIEEVTDTIAEVLDDYFTMDIEDLMNKYNKKQGKL